MAEIIDLSTLSPEPVIVRIGNGDDIQEIDLTIVPAALTLSTSAKIQKYGSFDKIPDEEIIEVVAGVCGAVNPAITADWLKNSCTKPQLALLTGVVYTQMFRPPDGVKKETKGGSDPKNRSRRAVSSHSVARPTAGRRDIVSGPSPGTSS